MWSNLPLFPPQASTFAAQVDGLYAFLVVVSVVFGGLIVCLLVYFAVKYRRRTELEQPVTHPRGCPSGVIVDPHSARSDA